MSVEKHLSPVHKRKHKNRLSINSQLSRSMKSVQKSAISPDKSIVKHSEEGKKMESVKKE